MKPNLNNSILTASFLAAVFCFCWGCGAVDHLAVGDGHFEAGRFEQAVTEYGLALDENPESEALEFKLFQARGRAAEHYSRKGRMFFYSGRFTEGIELLEKALEYDPSDERARNVLDEFKRVKKQQNEILEQALADYSEARYLRALKRLTGAVGLMYGNIEFLARFEEIKRRYLSDVNSKAQSAYAAGRFLHAKGLLMRAESLVGLDEDNEKLLGRVNAKIVLARRLSDGREAVVQGEYFEAFIAYGDALRIDNGNSVAMEGMKKVREKGPEMLAGLGDSFKKRKMPVESLRSYARARSVGANPAEMALRSKVVRPDAADVLFREGIALEARGRLGAAMLRFLTARGLGYDRKTVDEAIRRVESKMIHGLVHTIVVRDFKNMSSTPGLGPRFSAALAEELRMRIGLSGLETVKKGRETEAGEGTEKLAGGGVEILDQRELDRLLSAGGKKRVDGEISGVIYDFSVWSVQPYFKSKSKKYMRERKGLVKGGSETVLDRYNYQVVFKKKLARASAAFELRDMLTGRVPEKSARPLVVDVAREDREVIGSGEAGIEDDPDELPSDRQMEELLLAKLVEQIAFFAASSVGRFGERYGVAAEQALDGGDSRQAIEHAVRYLLFSYGGDPARMKKLERFITENSGYDPGKRRVNEVFLPVDRVESR